MFSPKSKIAFPTQANVTANLLQSLKTASGQPRQGSQSPNPVPNGGSQTFPQHVSGVTAILKKSSDVSTKCTISFQRPVHDGLFVDVSVFVSGYQGNSQPVKVASGQSPVSFPLNNTGESLVFTVQANGPTGSAPLSSAPTTTAKLVSTPLATVPTPSGTGGGTGGGGTGGGSSSSAYQWVTLVADNVTDNRPVLAAAIAAVPSSGGTIFLVPVGTGKCYVSAFLTITTSATKIVGSGWSGNANQGATVLWFAANQAGLIINGAQSVVLEDFSLLSKDTGAVATDHGVWFKGLSGSPTVRNVGVKNFGGNGFLIDSTGGGNVDQWRFDQIFAASNFGDGFQIVGGSDGNVGVCTLLTAESNQGWGLNLVTGAGGNMFLNANFAGNVTGGVQIAQSSNRFYGLYIENDATPSNLVITSVAGNNLVEFNNFGQAATITNSGGLSNIIKYNLNGLPGYTGVNINPATPGAGRTYRFLSGVFNGGDLSLSDDLGVTWLDINQSVSTMFAFKTFGVANFTGATLAGGSTNSGTLQMFSQYWNPSTLSGTVNTSSTGNAVTWVSGSVFNATMVGHVVVINLVSYTVATFVSSTSITLSTNPGNQAGVAYAFGSSANELWNIQTIGGAGANGTSTLTFSHTGTSGVAAIQLNAGLLVQAATPAGAASQLGLGTTTGFGNGTPATAVTTTTLGTGSGPANPQTIVNHLKVTIGGTVYYIPLIQ